ncbi:MAG: methionyl-tRNA formyltransferase [Candidatus Limnocylindrales bacterium]
MTARPRAVFLGTGAFAVPILDALVAAPDVVVVAVVTAPPRPAGRGQALRGSPVAARAADLSLPVLTPTRLRAPDAIAAGQALAPDLLVLADYGQIVPAELLALPAHGALNLHPSLLPRHRGATPIPAAILAGDAETGVTLMRMDAGLDSGPIVAQQRLALDGTETAPELERRLAALAADLLRRSLTDWLAGRLAETPQKVAEATMTRPLRRQDGRLDATQPAVELARRVRAYQSWPGAYVDTVSGRLLIWRAEAVAGDGGARDVSADAGSIVADGEGLAIATADGRLRLVDVQPAGKRRMAGAALRRGRPGLVGSRIEAPTLR